MTSIITNTSSSTCNEADSHLHDVGEFLADYTAWLWGCGSTCERIDKNVERIAAKFGCTVDIALMPKHFTVTVTSDATGKYEILTRTAAKCGINFNLNALLSSLSWEIAEHHSSITVARRRFETIIRLRYDNWIRIILLASLANASFCRIFGGDGIAMLIVFAATLAGMLLKHVLLRLKVDSRPVWFLCAFLSSLIAAGGCVLGLGETPRIALATSILYLIPGVPYLNAASDLIGKHYLVAFSRFMDACVLTACLTVGLWLGIAVTGLDTYIM